MQKTAKLYFTSDVHGAFFSTNYKQKDPCNMGLFAIADEICSKKENTLLIDGGDMIQGSPLLQYLQKSGKGYEEVSSTINDIGYDLITLGNHDFNFGYETLKNYTNNIQAKVLCCNLIDKKNAIDFLPYHIEKLENGLTIGFIGAVTDYVNVWEAKEHLRNLEVLPTFECIKKTHDELVGKVDVLVCIYHGGFEQDINNLENYSLITSGENVGLAICKEMEFDLLLTGHQHMQVQGKNIFGTHTLQVPSNATWYADIDITFTENKRVQIQSRNIAANALNTNTKLEDKYADLQKNVQSWLDIPVGKLSHALTQTNPLEIMQNGWRFSELCNSIILEKIDADMCCTSLMNEPYPLSKTITMRDIVSAYPFQNEITTVEVNSHILKEALEHVASFFVLKNGELGINPKYTKQKLELYNFDFYYGIEYSFDLTKEIGNRVVRLQKEGKDLNTNKTYRLGLTGYRASGAGGYDMFKECKIISRTIEDVQQMLIERITGSRELFTPKEADYKVFW